MKYFWRFLRPAEEFNWLIYRWVWRAVSSDLPSQFLSDVCDLLWESPYDERRLAVFIIPRSTYIAIGLMIKFERAIEWLAVDECAEGRKLHRPSPPAIRQYISHRLFKRANSCSSAIICISRTIVEILDLEKILYQIVEKFQWSPLPPSLLSGAHVSHSYYRYRYIYICVYVF